MTNISGFEWRRIWPHFALRRFHRSYRRSSPPSPSGSSRSARLRRASASAPRPSTSSSPRGSSLTCESRTRYEYRRKQSTPSAAAILVSCASFVSVGGDPSRRGAPSDWSLCVWCRGRGRSREWPHGRQPRRSRRPRGFESTPSRPMATSLRSSSCQASGDTISHDSRRPSG
jgi:hypothetical protein